MLAELHANDRRRAAALFAALDHHLTVAAVLAGTAEGQVLVDDALRPTAGLVRTPHRLFFAGDPGSGALMEGARRLFLEDLAPHAREAGEPPLAVLYYAPGWEAAVRAILDGTDPLTDTRAYLAHASPATARSGLLPEGFALRTVDAALFAERLWTNADALQEEMCSERPSVAAFYGRSVGICVTRGDEIVAWCLSEYNTGDRCEVGIETVRAYQRRGLATAAAVALLELVSARGIRQVGWHAWARNIASFATAHAAGFQDVAEYAVMVIWFDPAQHMAVHGNVRLEAGDYAGAAEYFSRSLATGEAPAWGWWRAACALARLGREDQALETLQQALAHGFRDRRALEQSEHLAPLRGTAAWEHLMSTLE